MPTLKPIATVDPGRRAIETALVEVRVAFAHEGAFITACLSRLADLVDAHSSSRQSAGVIEDIVEHEPRLANLAAPLIRDHEVLPQALADLRGRFEALEREAADLCDRIVEHHRLGDRLTYEAFMTDVGGPG